MNNKGIVPTDSIDIIMRICESVKNRRLDGEDNNWDDSISGLMDIHSIVINTDMDEALINPSLNQCKCGV